MDGRRKTYWRQFAWLFVMMTVFAVMSRSVLVFVAGVFLATIGAWRIRRGLEGTRPLLLRGPACPPAGDDSQLPT